MPSKEFTPNEWKKIIAALDKDPDKYGFPRRVPGSVLFGSFNIRKLGNPSNRGEETWDFLKRVCRQFDLLAIQEVMDNLDGIRKLQHLLGGEYGLIISDKTGVFPGERGLGERLAFDHIGLFSRDERLPTYKENESMGQKPLGPDYGMFNFVQLFCDALGKEYITPAKLMKLGKKNPKRKKLSEFVARFEHEVSDHMPIWLRLPLP